MRKPALVLISFLINASAFAAQPSAQVEVTYDEIAQRCSAQQIHITSEVAALSQATLEKGSIAIANPQLVDLIIKKFDCIYQLVAEKLGGASTTLAVLEKNGQYEHVVGQLEWAVTTSYDLYPPTYLKTTCAGDRECVQNEGPGFMDAILTDAALREIAGPTTPMTPPDSLTTATFADMIRDHRQSFKDALEKEKPKAANSTGPSEENPPVRVSASPKS